ncbi:MAG: DUF2971 domain-containing protein [Atopobiaceae bacterium]|nr:DUF2971 domain-containing protein [Atopobiaceae bacterium]
MGTTKMDPFLYTYCSLQTLVTMVEKGTLRFSDIRKSNDTKELSYGFNQIKKRLMALVADNRRAIENARVALSANEVKLSAGSGLLVPLREDRAQLCDEYNQRLYAFFLDNCFDEDDAVSEGDFLAVCDYAVERLSSISHAMSRERQGRAYKKDTAELLIPRCLAMCFTGNGDLLSQWRGYGDDGRGVSVGFWRSDVQHFVSWWEDFESAMAHEPGSVKTRHLVHDAVYYRDMDDSFSFVTTGEMRHRRFMEERWELARGNMLRRDEVSLCDMRIFLVLQSLLGDGVPERDDVWTRRRSIGAIFRICRDVVPLFKQRLFYEEEEERLFLWMEGGKEVEGLSPYVGQTASRRVTSDGFASYLDVVAIRNDARGTKRLGPAPEIPIARVVIGPRCVASEHDIASLFAGRGVATPEILRSCVPYDG